MTGRVKIDELINGERKFLHDVSNHLLVAQGMGNFVHNYLNKNLPKDAKERNRMMKTMKAIDQMIELVRDRREFIKNCQE